MFVSVDGPSLAQGVDLVIHTAGPFQWKETCAVLEAAISAGTPYIDVCDDADYANVSSNCKQLRVNSTESDLTQVRKAAT